MGRGSDKYIRLTGMWPSKSNKSLFTGRLKPDQIEQLLDAAEEAMKNDAPLIFSMWDNADKKRNRKDPDFNLQVFVGDSEEKPRERGRGRERDEEPRRRGRDEEPEDEQDASDEPEDEPEEEKPKPRAKTSSRTKPKPAKRESW